jgi:Ca2+-binding RTX toxin-like protein
MRKPSLAGAVALGIALAIPSGALASTAEKSGTQVTVSGAGGENNAITVSHNPATLSYWVTDSVKITPAAPCTKVTDTFVTCPDAGVTTIVLNGGNGDDTLTLDENTIPVIVQGRLNGDQGKDSLIGAATADTQNGGQGEDTLDGRKGGDSMSGGSGKDSVTYAASAAGVTVTVGFGNGDDGNANDQSPGGRDTVGSDVETIAGSAFADLIFGDASDESLFGNAGADAVRGGDGGDAVIGGPDDDIVVGGAGNDKVVGKAGADIMKGKSGLDRLKGRDGQGDIRINCGSGDNRQEFGKFDRGLDPRPKRC